MRDRPAACADFHEVKHRNAHRNAATPLEPMDVRHLEFGRARHAPFLHEAHFRGGAPHVERQDMIQSCKTGIMRGTKRARRRPGFDDADGKVPCRVDRIDPTARLRQQRFFPPREASAPRRADGAAVSLVRR